MEPLNAGQFNELFNAALDGGDVAMEKLGEVTGLFIQDKLRENSFTRKILPPQTVTAAELTRNVDDEGLSYIDDIEPDSIAMRVNFRGEPEKTYIQGNRYEIRFSTISSDRFQKSEQELRSYKMPLTKVIEQNTVKDIQEQVDRTFMQHVRASLFLSTLQRHNELLDRGTITLDASAGAADALSVSGAGQSFKNFRNQAEFISYVWRGDKFGAWADNTTNLPEVQTVAGTGSIGTAPIAQAAYYSNILMASTPTFDRTVLRDLIKVHANRQLKCRTFLLHESDWADVVAWSDTEAGLEVTSEIVKDGYKYTTVGGYTFVTTVRDNPDIIEPGQIFGFPSAEFLGRYLLLESTKFWIEKKGRFVSMEAWEDCGLGFGNVKGIACILLQGASITLPAVWRDEVGALESAAANSNEWGYDPTLGQTVVLKNDATDPSGGTLAYNAA